MKSLGMTLVSHKLCPYVQRARIVLDEKAVPHELEFIDLSRKPEWFQSLSPLGKVPVLLVDGQPLFESAAIVEYLDETTLGSMHPTDALLRAQHRAWIEFASNTLDAISAFYRAPDSASFEESITKLKTLFRTLEGRLDAAPYFNGTRFSLVDAAFGPVFRYFDVIESYDDFEFFADMPRVEAWRNALSERPSVQRAVVADYAERLHRFFLDRGSMLTRVIREGAVA